MALRLQFTRSTAAFDAWMMTRAGLLRFYDSQIEGTGEAFFEADWDDNELDIAGASRIRIGDKARPQVRGRQLRRRYMAL
jgi:hypothetical protein